MSNRGNPVYPYMGPQQQMPPQRYQQMMRPYPPQQVMEGYNHGYQNMEQKPFEQQDRMNNLKYDYGSPHLYQNTMTEPKDNPKQFISRIPKVNSEQIDSILAQNYDILKTMNDSKSIEDPQYITNLSKLHQNLLFLARISDQQM